MSDTAIYAFNSKQFEDALDQIAQRLTSDIAAHANDLKATGLSVHGRRARVLKGDFRFFCYTYFPHHIRGEPSAFQRDYTARFPQMIHAPEGWKEWWVAPRGEAKSTLISKLTPLYVATLALLQLAAVRSEIGWKKPVPAFIDYVILLGAESDLPGKFLTIFKTELTANANLVSDFPELAIEVSKADRVVTAQKVMFEAFGAGQAIRGTTHGASRPRLIIADDLITDEEAASERQRNTRWEWLTNAVEYLGPPDGSVKFLAAGTRMHPNDPIGMASRTVGHVVHHYKALEAMPTRMDLWSDAEALMRVDDKLAEDAAKTKGHVLAETERPSFQFYQKNKAAMDAGAIVSWPQVRPLFRVMRTRAMNVATFNKEMQGTPRTNEDKVFTRVTPWTTEEAHWVYFGGCDPSLGKSQTSDPSGLVVAGLDLLTMRLHVIEAVSARRVPSKLFADLCRLQEKYNCQSWGFEDNNAYSFMRDEFAKQARERGVTLPLIGLTAIAAKEMRINQMEPLVVDDAAIRVHPRCTALLDQLDAWPENQSHHHYDLLDALYLAFTVAITRRARFHATLDPATSMNVARPYSSALGALDLNRYTRRLG